MQTRFSTPRPPCRMPVAYYLGAENRPLTVSACHDGLRWNSDDHDRGKAPNRSGPGDPSPEKRLMERRLKLDGHRAGSPFRNMGAAGS